MAEILNLVDLDELRHQVRIESLPVEDGWANVVISNGVINLCPDKIRVYQQIFRVLRPGGRMTVADICLERPVPEEALHDIDLWTG
jgi:arsenite methyltransferase